MSLCTLINRDNLFKHRNPTMAFELSIFDDINSESGFTYGRTIIFLSLFEPISVFITPDDVTALCTNNFFSLKFILLNIRSISVFCFAKKSLKTNRNT